MRKNPDKKIACRLYIFHLQILVNHTLVMIHVHGWSRMITKMCVVFV